jgi:hypothetical protein
LVTGARCALGLVVSVATFGTLGACGGRYELGEDEASGGKAGAGGKATTGGTGGSVTGSGGSAGTGGKGGGTGGGGTGGTEISTGGTGGDGVTGGTGNVGPDPNGLRTAIRRTLPRKLDLLLMVDNSRGMEHKQALLEDALPTLLRRLAHPDCVDENGAPTGDTMADGACDTGLPEQLPINDIHVGVITSSLGDHGSGDVCAETSGGANDYNDGAELVGTVRSGLPSYENSGFLDWDPSGLKTPPGVSDLDDLTTGVVNHVRAVGTRGCGYEASLESWYRFLVDPEPVRNLTNDQIVNVRGPVNEAVLAQRAAFMRKDSTLAIVMLSDENDCSINDENGTQGWLVPYKGGPSVNSWRMPRATGACAADPNSPDCLPCTSTGVPGCEVPSLTTVEDPMNLRCFRQKQRFGVDLLYPTGRYVEAITSPLINPRLDGNMVSNPIFDYPNSNLRDPQRLILMGILGVPWQDLATDESLGDAPLSYMRAFELHAASRWDVILGGVLNAPPTDPFMVESIEPRPAGVPHPILGTVGATVGPDDDTAAWNPINGRDHRPNSDGSELQHACIFPLAQPIPCTQEALDAGKCVCDAEARERNSPLCDFEASPTEGIQLYDRAYPSLRQLDVLSRSNESAVVTSVCPKGPLTTEEPVLGPGYGYRPAMDALFTRVKESFAPLCWPLPLTTDADRRVDCRVHEARLEASCDCGAPGRSPTSDTDLAGIRAQMIEHGICGGQTGVDCNTLCACDVQQFEGEDLEYCQNDYDDDGTRYGFCFVDPGQGAGDPALVQGCPADQKRSMRFLGEGVATAPNGLSFITCDPE